MPGYLLRREQISSLVALAGLGGPGTASPLRGHVRAEDALAADDPERLALVEQGLIRGGAGGERVNVVARGYLEACLQPDEVISVGIDDVGHPGLGVVRRGNLWAECTADWRGSAKLYFPLSRSAVIATLVEPIGPGAMPGAEAFAFAGSVPDAFVLSVLARELREDPRPPALAELAAGVQRALDRPSLSLGFQLLGGPEVLNGLRSAEVVSVAVGRLQSEGHVALRGERVVLAPNVEAALEGFPEATFAITRTLVAGDAAQSHWLHATRAGGRTLIFRPRSPRGGELQLEWREVGGDDLRLLVAGMLLEPAGAASEA